jgi:transcriptional regulator with XRE-family HTH domain
MYSDNQKLRNQPSFGNNIRNIRKSCNMTQEYVVTKLQLMNQNISRSIYSQIECGTYNIKISELVALKKIFHVEYSEFFNNLDN